ncbi:DUF4291 family protein [Chryseobacterium arthrosphaerae]|uniref:DUF4291 family protein n=1 Tax=Chryseobacterium arthrosphaerae TaxID=651561 RepID=A0ABU7R3Q4_9FLAO|nr:DUF4291 family protein [Chryseobacterium arthrosphaerae]
MEINLKKYKEQLDVWPEKGHHIMAQYDNEKIIVYQSYKKRIGEFAVKKPIFWRGFQPGKNDMDKAQLSLDDVP